MNPIFNVNGSALAKVLLILLILSGIFITVHTYMLEVDVSSMPAWIATYVNYAIIFFQYAPVMFLAGFVRNIYGFLTQYFRTNMTEQYSMNKYLQTLSFYGGIICTIGIAVPQPYGSIGAMFIIVGEFLISEAKKLRSPVISTPVAPAV